MTVSGASYVSGGLIGCGHRPFVKHAVSNRYRLLFDSVDCAGSAMLRAVLRVSWFATASSRSPYQAGASVQEASSRRGQPR